ncbi:MAG: beta-ketoacyl synthase N-terminal-like domain-containing protein, partial [Elusimicrobiota bacterium]
MARAFITGLGPFCSLGEDAKSFWKSLLEGRCRAAKLPSLKGCPVPIGASAGSTQDRLSPKEAKLDPCTRFAMAASAIALEDAGLAKEALPSERAGIVVGSSRGAAELLETHYARFMKEGPGSVSPHASPHTTAGNLPGALSRRFGLRGPTLFVSAACSSASQALGLALGLIRSGKADLMLAGGSEACLTPFCMSMFASTGILSTRVEEPERACRPFDRLRDGMGMGEGAAAMVLESEAHAGRRPASHALCRVAGWGF